MLQGGQGEEAAGAGGESSAVAAGYRWAELMRRAFDVDVLACPRCGGRLRLLALLEAGVATARILRHLGLATEVPRRGRPGRRPCRATASRSDPVCVTA